MSDLSKPQKVFMGIMYGLTAIASILLIYVVYCLIEKAKPETLGTIYAGTLTCTEEDINVIEVKIHSNENNNGQACYEILYNGYTDYQGGAVKGFGMQSNTKDNYAGQEIYLTTSNEQVITWLGGIQLYNTDDNAQSSYVVNEMPTELYIDIDGAFYKIAFENFEHEEISTKGWNTWNELFGITTKKTQPYNFYTLFDYICESAFSDSAKYENGEFSISLLDCSKYIKFYYQDTDTQYKPLDEASTMYEFLKIHITYSKDGMTDASQSLFHQYYGNSAWSYYNNTEIEDYWNAYTTINLTEQNLNYIYNEDKSSYYATIDEKFSTYLKGLTNAEIALNINFDNLDFDVYGINLEHFNFTMKAFEITTANADNFTIYNETACETAPNIKAV